MRRVLDADPHDWLEVRMSQANLKREDHLRKKAGKVQAELQAAAPRLNTDDEAWAAVAQAATILADELGRPEKAIEILSWAAGVTTGILKWGTNGMLARCFAETGQFAQAQALLKTNASSPPPSDEDIARFPDVPEVIFYLGGSFDRDLAVAGLLAGDDSDARALLANAHYPNYLLQALTFQIAASAARANSSLQAQTGSSEAQSESESESESEADCDREVRSALAMLGTNGRKMDLALFRAWSGDANGTMAILVEEDQRGRLSAASLLKFAGSPLAMNLRHDDRFLELRRRYNVAPEQLATIPFDFSPPKRQPSETSRAPAP